MNLQHSRRFAQSGGCASTNISCFRLNFAVALSADPSYSWQALTTSLHATCDEVLTNEIAFAWFSDNLS
jgi:hypothetical protein